MSLNVIFDPKAPQEEVIYSFDFSPLLASGEVISSAVITCRIYSGYDPNPEDLISGTLVNNSPIITQEIKGGILNNVYLLKCLATIDNGEKRLIVASLTIQELEPHNYS